MNQIKLNTLWRYIGPLPGTGETHKIIAIERGNIITTSGNHSWMGDADNFLTQFRYKS